MNIPFVNLQVQYESIQTEIDRGISEALKRFQFSKGFEVSEFERHFPAKLKSKYCIAVGNGTDALFLSLKAIDIQPGDEVLTPSWSWISTSETISFCGATPVFVDVDPSHYTIDIEAVKSKITPKTRAIIAVHLYGQAARASELRELCDKNNIKLIEDCAQGHLTIDGNSIAGSIGHISAFSFYPTKNLGAYGDAGCVLTNGEALAEKVRRLANHGALQKDDHLIEGTNSRMDTIQAAILLAKLPFLEQWTEKRIQNASYYSTLLQHLPQIRTPKVRENTRHTFQIYAIRCEQRDELKTYLEAQGIQTIIHYPNALTNLPAYQYLNLDASQFPVSNALQKDILSLPIYPELTKEQIFYVFEKISDFYKRGKH
jgi:dTDP-4-amino-4,6-dideoxygalactose transaminase